MTFGEFELASAVRRHLPPRRRRDVRRRAEAAVAEARAGRRAQPDSRSACGRCSSADGGRTCSSTPASATRWTRRDVEIYGIDRTPAPRSRRWPTPGVTRGRHRHRARLAPAFRSRRRLHDARDGRPCWCRVSARDATSSGAREWEDATHPHERNRASYLPENFVPLQDAGVARFHRRRRRGHARRSASWRTGGHTMHHQIVRIESGGRTAVFAADLMPTTAHVDEPWIMGYDLYPMDTLAFKKRFVREAIDARVRYLLRARSGDRGRHHPRDGRPEVRRAQCT